MKALYYLTLCGALILSACNDENGNGGNKEIILAEGTPEEVVVKADEKESSQVIKFTAVAAWTATVKDVTSSRAGDDNEVEWIKLSAYSGEAGEVSLYLSFSKNLTGITRKAEINIQCGETIIKIAIEQLAENADGTITKQLKTIKGKWEFNSEIVGDAGGNPISEQTTTYSYDNQGRVVKVISIDEDGSEDTFETIYDYSILNEIQITYREYYKEDTYEERYVADLNENGNAVRIREFFEGKYINENKIEYSEEGRITSIKEYDENNKLEEEINYTYDKDGYLIKAVVEDRYGNDSGIYSFDIPTTYPNKYPNNNIIDMLSFYDTHFFGSDESIITMSQIGRLGKTGDYFIERVKKDDLEVVIPIEESSEAPGTVIREVKYQNADFNNYDDEYSFEYDKDKNLTKVTLTSKFDIKEISYKIVVTDKVSSVIDGIKYYFCEDKDYKNIKIGENKDITTFTLGY